MRQGSRLVRNTVSNFLAQVIPLVVGVVSLPYIVHGLGPEGFGILALAWVLVGYFGIFDLGLGRATTKFVAEAMSRGEDERISKIVWSSLATQAVLGIAGGALLAIATPFLAGRILKIPLSFTAEMRAVLYLLSASIPVVVCSRNVRGVLEAAQHFDLINAIRIPLGVLTFLVPLAGAVMHFRVSVIVFLLILLIAASTIAYLACTLRVFPVLATMPVVDKTLIPPLLVFGGWVTVSYALIPTLAYLDRLLIGAVVSVTALTYYTTPHEVASRLLIFPAALSTTLFPAFSALSAINTEDLKRLYVRSLKYIVLGLGPVAFIGAAFGEDILRIWLGNDFAVKGSLVFKILSAGILPNALSLMPSNLLDSVGRPDLRAKVFVSYAFAYVPALWLLIAKFGITGAALAWSARGTLECLLFFVVSAKVLAVKPALLFEHGLRRAIVVYSGLVLLTSTSLFFVTQPVVQGTVTLLWLGLFGAIAWRYVLDDEERALFRVSTLMTRMRNPAEGLGV